MLVPIVNWPEEDDAVVGSNPTSMANDWPGFKVAGSVAPETENPVPLTIAEFTATGAVPVEVTVTACDTGEFRTTLPKLIDVEFTVTAGVPVLIEGESAMLKLALSPPDCAVMV